MFRSRGRALAQYHVGMDSTDATPWGRWLLLPVLALPLIAWTTTLPGCAEPCLDDGLGQKFCPPADTEAATGDTIAGDGDGDGDSAESNEAGETEGCPLLDVILVPQTPTLVLLVDQSLSMEEDFGGDTRWNVITNVLIAPNTGIVPQFAAAIRLGLTLYSSIDGNTTGMECPMLVEVAPELDNAAMIETQMSMAAPLGETPTGESLDVVWQQLDALDVPGRKFIVLATDGEPDTCAEPNPQNGQDESLAAAQAAYAAGIETFVISVGAEVSEAHLQDMANAGQGVQPGDPDAAFYLALDQGALVAAFEDILAGVRSCQLDLMSSLTAEDAAICSVEVNGTIVPLDDPNGWQLNSPTEVELLGSACDALQTGTSSVQMECACGVGS
jgi:hypothetical protein